MQLWGVRTILWDVLRPPHNCFLWKRLQQKHTLARPETQRAGLSEHTIFYSEELRSLWPTPLASEWRQRYPDVFDERDAGVNAGKSCQPFFRRAGFENLGQRINHFLLTAAAEMKRD